MLVKLTPVVNSTNSLHAAFVSTTFDKKLQTKPVP